MNQKSDPVNIAQICLERENMSCVKGMAERIQKNGFYRIGEWLPNVSTIDLVGVRACLMTLAGGAEVGETPSGHSMRGRKINIGKARDPKDFDFGEVASAQVILIAEMLSVGEGLPSIMSDVVRSTMAIGLLKLYVHLEVGSRNSGGAIELRHDKFSMDPDFILTDWNRLIKFDAYDEDQREILMEARAMIEGFRETKTFIEEKLVKEEHSHGYQEPKVDRSKLSQDPVTQMNDLNDRLKGLFGG